eukprot:280465-Prorocentrum_minimum.AAC.1
MGVAGIAASRMTESEVVVTDGHLAVVHLIRRNLHLAKCHADRVSAATLRWVYRQLQLHRQPLTFDRSNLARRGPGLRGHA